MVIRPKLYEFRYIRWLREKS